MRTTIDRAGRIVVPKAIRERLTLLDGGDVEISERGGVIEIVPVPVEVEVVPGADGPVAVAPLGQPPLTDADVFAAIERLRR